VIRNTVANALMKTNPFLVGFFVCLLCLNFHRRTEQDRGTRSKTAPEDVLSLSYAWSSHKRGRQNTLGVMFSNAPKGTSRNISLMLMTPPFTESKPSFVGKISALLKNSKLKAVVIYRISVDIH